MNIYPDFEFRCPTCSGSGSVQGEEDVYVCWKCNGAGAVLTRQGHMLIEFLGRHLQAPDHRHSAYDIDDLEGHAIRRNAY